MRTKEDRLLIGFFGLLFLAFLLFLATALVRAEGGLPPWVTVTTAEDCTGGCWELVEVEYLDEQESGGLHHVLARTKDAQGNYIVAPFALGWASGQDTAQTKLPPDYGDLVMWDCFFPDQGEVGGYRTWAGVWEANSDVVSGLGLPYCIHHSIRLTWQWRNAGEIPTATPTRLPTPTAAPPPPLPYQLAAPLIRR